jgi:hypothetical protein
MDSPKLRALRGRLICTAHYNAAGPAMYHTPGCWRCAEVQARLIAEGKPIKPDATTMTRKERMRRSYKDSLTGKASAEQIAIARARGFAAMGLAR